MSKVETIAPVPAYEPTVYVNNSEPDLDETHLNKTEQALKRVTDAANEAIAALKELNTVKISTSQIVNNLLATDPNTVLAGPMGKTLSDKYEELQRLYAQLNGDLGDFESRFSDLPYEEHKFLSESVYGVERKRGEVNLFIQIFPNDKPIMEGYSIHKLPFTLPTGFKPQWRVNNIRCIPDVEINESAFININTDGTVELCTRYNGLSPGDGFIYVAACYTSTR